MFLVVLDMLPSKRRVDSLNVLSTVAGSVVDPFSGLRPRTPDATAKTSPAFWSPSIYCNVELVVLISVWYMCAICTITTTKEVMNRFQFPFLLCCSQFTFASVLSYAYLLWSNRYKAVSPEASSVVLQIAATYTLGFVFTNIAFSLGKAE